MKNTQTIMKSKIKGDNIIIDQVDDGFNYFGYRLEELKTDDVYYIESFMRYIESLESKLKIAKNEYKICKGL